MIARIWHGWTTKSNAASYEKLLKNKILPEIMQKTGDDLLRVNVLRKEHKDEVEFLSILWFKDMESIKRWFNQSQNVFVNEQDFLAAHIPFEARKVLARWDDYATHYDCTCDSLQKSQSKL